LVGSKALGLTRLKKTGMRVPSGFCLTISAFREHIESNKLRDKIQTTLDRLGSASLGERGLLLSALRQAIVDAPVTDALRDEIEHHYHVLGTKAASRNKLYNYFFLGLIR